MNTQTKPVLMSRRIDDRLNNAMKMLFYTEESLLKLNNLNILKH